MSGKNQAPLIFNWQSTDPRVGFLPQGFKNGSQIPQGNPIIPPSPGVMTGTNTIYTNILEISHYDNFGIEVAWTGTPSGTITFYTSSSGNNFPSMTFSPSLAQPSGSAGYYGINVTQLGFKFIMASYTNSSGTGALSIYLQEKAIS